MEFEWDEFKAAANLKKHLEGSVKTMKRTPFDESPNNEDELLPE